jgi:TPR repeat protein
MTSYNTVYKRACDGDAEAAWLLCQLYSSGEILEVDGAVEVDKDQAVYWLKKAAEYGNSLAQVNLAYIYFNHEKDNAEGLEWLRLAAENGLLEAQATLGSCYMQGVYTEVSTIDAIFWLTKASKGKLSLAQYNLGILYQSNVPHVKDYKLAYIWLSAAIENNDPNSSHARKIIFEIEEKLNLTENELDMLKYAASEWC